MKRSKKCFHGWHRDFGWNLFKRDLRLSGAESGGRQFKFDLSRPYSSLIHINPAADVRKEGQAV
jgi:hypothetical protein